MKEKKRKEKKRNEKKRKKKKKKKEKEKREKRKEKRVLQKKAKPEDIGGKTWATQRDVAVTRGACASARATSSA
jgi:hypothetical protein